MKNSDSHIILYAKYHYKRTDVVEDLKRIYSHRNAIDVRYLSTADIASMLFSLYMNLVTDPSFSMGIILSMENFINDLRPDQCWRTGYIWKDNSEGYDIDLAIIYSCLSLLMNIQVKDTEKDKVLIPLDEPDFSILPKNEILTNLHSTEVS